jgi:hypothetical protein
MSEETASRNRRLARLLREWRQAEDGFSDEFWDFLERELQAERDPVHPSE